MTSQVIVEKAAWSQGRVAAWPRGRVVRVLCGLVMW